MPVILLYCAVLPQNCTYLCPSQDNFKMYCPFVPETVLPIQKYFCDVLKSTLVSIAAFVATPRQVGCFTKIISGHDWWKLLTKSHHLHPGTEVKLHADKVDSIIFPTETMNSAGFQAVAWKEPMNVTMSAPQGTHYHWLTIRTRPWRVIVMRLRSTLTRF